jgi:hypothetical protein
VTDAAGFVLSFVPAAICATELVLILSRAPKISVWLVAVPSFLVCVLTFFSVGLPSIPAAFLLLLAAAAYPGRQAAESA